MAKKKEKVVVEERKYAAPAIESFDIILAPIVTEKTMKQQQEENSQHILDNNFLFTDDYHQWSKKQSDTRLANERQAKFRKIAEDANKKWHEEEPRRDAEKLHKLLNARKTAMQLLKQDANKFSFTTGLLQEIGIPEWKINNKGRAKPSLFANIDLCNVADKGRYVLTEYGRAYVTAVRRGSLNWWISDSAVYS